MTLGDYVMHRRTNRMAIICRKWGVNQGCIHWITGGYLACNFSSLRELTDDEIADLEAANEARTEATLAMDLDALTSLKREMGL